MTLMDTSSHTSNRGRVIRGLPYPVKNHNPISIGADAGCAIQIGGADGHHAELKWNDVEGAWFIHDDPNPGETIVNGKSIECVKLEDRDWFEISKVRIRFAYGDDGDLKLSEIPPNKPVGLGVTLSHVSAVAGGETRLDNISFHVRDGEFVALLGPSGCGKSTLIQRIAGLADYTGEIKFNGNDLKENKASLQSLVAYLPQVVEDSLHADMKVHEAMEDFAHCHLVDNAEVNFMARLKDVELEEKSGEFVRLLSGGQKRRLALALALLREPQLLLLDEPTAGLDPAAEAKIMKLLKTIAKSGRTVLCATHVLGSLGLCDKVLILAPQKGSGGYPVFFGTPKDALKQFYRGGQSDWETWLSIYQMLTNNDGSLRRLREQPSDATPKKTPKPPPFASSLDAFKAVFMRLFRQTFFTKNILFSLGIPLGIAGVLLVACWQMFAEGGSIGTVCFCMVVAMFWLGLSGSVRNLVAERVPMRCLDKMRGMSLKRYFMAHVVFAAAAIVIKSFIFTGLVFMLRHHPRLFAPGAFWMFWLVLAFVGFSGSCVGLWVSSICKKEIQAVGLLPLAAIFALFLSKPVLEMEGQKLQQPLRAIEYMMPTRNAQTVLETELLQKRVDNADPKAHFHNVLNFSLQAIGYPLVFLPWAYRVQKRREDEWDGR